jgi:glycosyltransferase involved in cell wall biosynthesis
MYINKNIYHIIPKLKIGGIETMLIRYLNSCPLEINYKLIVIANVNDYKLESSTLNKIHFINGNNIFACYFNALMFILLNRNNIFITSTYKSVILFYIINIFVKLNFHVSFTHRSSTAHFVDKYFRKWQIKNSKYCIADSIEASRWIKNISNNIPVKVIIPLFKPNINITYRNCVTDTITICYIGRLAKVKNFQTIFQFIKILSKMGKKIVFDIYGPDDGELNYILNWIKFNSSDDLLCSYKGHIDHETVYYKYTTYNYAISLSHTEGFGMSIAEAITVGTVPIVGFVGGLRNYCNDLNSIIVKKYTVNDLYQAACRLLYNSDNPSIYNIMSNNCLRTFSNDNYFENNYSNYLKYLLNKL